MGIRYPAPLRPGDRIGVTAPSSGVPADLAGRLTHAIRTVERRGYEVVVGDCMDGTRHVSAPAADRARELMAMLTDPSIKAVAPPWGGETAIDLLPLLDWDTLADAAPTWFVGYSDLSTIMTPLTLLTGVATVHGNNLMDTPYRPPAGLLSWLDVVTMTPGTTFTQTPPGRYRTAGQDDWETDPEADTLTLDGTGRWTRLDAGTGDLKVSGRLIGGCIETLCNLTGTVYGDIAGFARAYAPDGLLIYLEAAEGEAGTICRALHGMRLAGFFTGANAVLIGRTAAPPSPWLTQHDAVRDALGGLDIPIIADVECGHVPPYLPLINGAQATVRLTDSVQEITQTL
ncbi:S66 family peptidase [Catenuloplanes atrovinosus]|uniref:Muramoyltetrapeptide carboxypeptidase LdcA involved in peptidoglycan recycling n=1 Tax=Catenuloplanes atrovinosus TaxID=137266 RepID=A0AAE3YJ33_9ACTN|nr:LD-carboxypeptidase [Catenuloplanes atrovinosus]MDR7274415.1 muramoyltetrapeptide carboxypeptidase LdcA involved in peptidoglycan recycling [Catenuloplanes atrovinosus]